MTVSLPFCRDVECVTLYQTLVAASQTSSSQFWCRPQYATRCRFNGWAWRPGCCASKPTSPYSTPNALRLHSPFLMACAVGANLPWNIGSHHLVTSAKLAYHRVFQNMWSTVSSVLAFLFDLVCQLWQPSKVYIRRWGISEDLLSGVSGPYLPWYLQIFFKNKHE